MASVKRVIFIKHSFSHACSNDTHKHTRAHNRSVHRSWFWKQPQPGCFHERLSRHDLLPTVHSCLLSVSVCLSVCLFIWLCAHCCIIFWGGVALVGETVCHPRHPCGRHFPIRPQRGRKSVSHFIYPSVWCICACACVWEWEWVWWFVSQARFWPWPFAEAMWQKFTEPNSPYHSQPDTPPHCL